jgi:hypothetical protein
LYKKIKVYKKAFEKCFIIKVLPVRQNFTSYEFLLKSFFDIFIVKYMEDPEIEIIHEASLEEPKELIIVEDNKEVLVDNLKTEKEPLEIEKKLFIETKKRINELRSDNTSDCQEKEYRCGSPVCSKFPESSSTPRVLVTLKLSNNTKDPKIKPINIVESLNQRNLAKEAKLRNLRVVQKAKELEKLRASPEINKN